MKLKFQSYVLSLKGTLYVPIPARYLKGQKRERLAGRDCRVNLEVE